MGSTGNGVNPLQINSHIVTKPVTVHNFMGGSALIDPAGFNITSRYCGVSYEDSAACSCQDCKKSCGAPPPPIIEPEPCLIMGNSVYIWLTLRLIDWHSPAGSFLSFFIVLLWQEWIACPSPCLSSSPHSFSFSGRRRFSSPSSVTAAV